MKSVKLVVVGVALLVSIAGSAHGGTTWGEAWGDSGKICDLTNRTSSAGAYLDSDELAASVKEVRFVKGDILVDHINIEGRDIRFVGAAEGTTLKPDPEAFGQLGGAICVTDARMSVTNLTFSGFYAETAGGALALWGATGDSAIQNCHFKNCKVAPYVGVGGAIYASAATGTNATLAITGCSFVGCQAVNGGAVTTERIYPYKEKSITLSFADCAFTNNVAGNRGGAIWNEGDVKLARTIFKECSAGVNGGAICSGSSDAGFAGLTVELLAGVTFEGNSVTDIDANGGAIALMSPGVRLVGTHAAFLSNLAQYVGGAIFASSTNVVNLSTSIFSGNKVKYDDGFGGALSVDCSTCALTNLTVRGSNAGAIAFYMTKAEIVNCVVIGNTTNGVPCDIVAESPDGETRSLKLDHTAYGSLYADANIAVAANACLADRTTADYDGDTLYLKGLPDYNPVCAEGLPQTANDYDGVAYGSREVGTSMGAYECPTILCTGAEGWTGMYDGMGHVITPTSCCVNVTFTWTFATSEEGPYGAINPAYTNEGNYTTWVIASAPGFHPMTNSAAVSIAKRAINLVSASAKRAYNGEPLTSNDVWVTGSPYPLADGDTLSFLCSGSQTVVGVSTNDFTFSITNAQGVNARDNYTVGVTKGLLEVVKAGPPEVDPDPEEEFPEEAGPYYDNPNVDPPSPVTNGVIRALSNYDIVTVYDGRGHTFDYAALTNSIATNTWVYAGYKVTYSATGKSGSWTDNLASFTFTNVVSTSFWYNIEAPFGTPNYSNYVHAVGVVITNRHVTIGSESNTNLVYNGKAQTWPRVTADFASWDDIEAGKQTGFVPGEGIAWTGDWTTVTSVGEGVKTNEFTYTLALNQAYGSVTNNYFVTVTNGFIAISPRPVNPDEFAFDMPVTNFVYEAIGHEPRPSVSNTVTLTAVPKAHYEYSWFDNTNATDRAAVVVTFLPGADFVGAVTNYFKIDQRPVTLQAASAERPYDGTTLTTNAIFEVVITDGSIRNFVAGEGVVPTANMTAESAITEVGVTNNVINANDPGLVPLAGTLLENYDFSFEKGTLRVLTSVPPPTDVAQDPTHPDNGPYYNDPEDPQGPSGLPKLPQPGEDNPVLSRFDVTNVYAGVGYTVDTNAIWAAATTNLVYSNKLSGVTYSLTGERGSWTDEPPTFTDVTETSFWYKVVCADSSYSNYIHAVGVVITQRVVQVTSGSESWPYNGEAHSNMTVKVTKGDFVEGEGITSNNFNTITTVGTNDNWFTVGWIANTKPTNYDFSVVTGKIAVQTAKMPDPDHKPTPGPDYPPEAGPFPGPYFPDPKEPPTPTNKTDGTGWQKLSNYDLVTVYDGAAHTFDTNLLWTTLNVMKDRDFHGNAATVTYSLTGEEGTWGNDPYFFTNVTETPTSFWYQVEVANYSNYVHAAAVIITNRPVTITFEADSKEFDTTTTATCTKTNFANVVTGEEFAFSTTNMLFNFDTPDVGEGKLVTATNYGDVTQRVIALGETLKSNYTFHFVDTTNATIRAKTADFTVVAIPEEFVWNPGIEHFPTNFIVRDGTRELKWKVDYDYTRAPKTNIGKYDVVVTGVCNYAGSSGYTNFWITAHEVETWIEDVCQGVVTNGEKISGNEVVAVCPPKEGYCVDAQNSVTNGIVRRSDDPKGLLRLVVRYEKDSNGDDVPDKYQRLITFRVVNGWWNAEPSSENGGSAPIQLWVTKYAADGTTWDVNGSNTLSAVDIPAVGNRPFGTGFVKGGQWWPATPTSGMWVSNATSPLFLFAYNRAAGGGSLRGSGRSVENVIKGVAGISTFNYKDGKAEFSLDLKTFVNGSLIVSMPLEETQVTILGATSLDTSDWTPLVTKRTDMTGYVYVTVDTGSYRFFKIEVK